jgi:hypothetical protein
VSGSRSWAEGYLDGASTPVTHDKTKTVAVVDSAINYGSGQVGVSIGIGAAGFAASALEGAEEGGVIGTVIAGPAGTLVGGLIGAVGGAFGGYLADNIANWAIGEIFYNLRRCQ